MEEKNSATGTQEVGMKRVLKLKDLVFYGMIMMVLIAPMAVFGEIEQISEGMTPLVYLVGMICMLFTAFSYKFMSSEFPIGGSVYAYVQHGVNHHVGFVAGWMILLDYIFVPALVYALVSSIASGTFGLPPIVWILLFIAVNIIINVRGIEYTAKADIVLFFVELVTVLVIVVFGLKFVFGTYGMDAVTIDPLYQPGKINMSFIASACTIAALSFLGFDGISTLAEEAVNPKKDIGNAIIISLVAVSFIFIIQTYVGCLILPDWQSTDIVNGFYDAVALALGEWFRILNVCITIVAVGIANTLVAQSSAARLLYTMGRDKVIPSFLGKLHPKFHTPHIAIYTLSIFSFIVAATIQIPTLVRLVNLGAITSFIILNASTIYYFLFKKKERGIGAIIKYGVTPFIGILILIFISTGFGMESYIVGAVWMVMGIIIGYVKSKGYKEVPEAFKNMQL